MSLVARTGRDRQRYENNFRLVSGCIPYKLTDENGYQINDRIKVLMVSTPDRDDLVFPKGGWEDDETVEEAACREAWEEAGVIGIIGKTLGEWEFRSKSRQEICSLEGGCKGRMFAMKVTKEHEVWPEQKNHDRKWLNIEDANRLCRYEWMRSALNEFLRIMAEDVRHETVDATVQTSSTPVSGIAAECEVESSYHRMKPSNTRRRVPPLRCSRSKTFIRRRPKLGAISPTTNSTQLNLKVFACGLRPCITVHPCIENTLPILSSVPPHLPPLPLVHPSPLKMQFKVPAISNDLGPILDCNLTPI